MAAPGANPHGRISNFAAGGKAEAAYIKELAREAAEAAAAQQDGSGADDDDDEDDDESGDSDDEDDDDEPAPPSPSPEAAVAANLLLAATNSAPAPSAPPAPLAGPSTTSAANTTALVGPALPPANARGSRSAEPLTKAYVDAHSGTENFHHRGKAVWARGLPAEGKGPQTPVRGPGAAAWKARASAAHAAKKQQQQ